MIHTTPQNCFTNDADRMAVCIVSNDNFKEL